MNNYILSIYIFSVLLERVFFRIGSSDTDTQLSSCINNFLVPVLQKLSSPHEPVRDKVLDELHFNYNFCFINNNSRSLNY